MTDHDDIIDVLNRPLWRGYDVAFTSYLHKMFDVPTSVDLVSIAPAGTHRRAAISIDGPLGAVVFVLSWSRRRRLNIQPVILGPMRNDPAVAAGISRFRVDLHSTALTQLALRHLPTSVVLDVLTPVFH